MVKTLRVTLIFLLVYVMISSLNYIAAYASQPNGREITFVYNGVVSTHPTSARTVGGFLIERGVTLHPLDQLVGHRISRRLDHRMRVEVIRASEEDKKLFDENPAAFLEEYPEYEVQLNDEAPEDEYPDTEEITEQEASDEAYVQEEVTDSDETPEVAPCPLESFVRWEYGMPIPDAVCSICLAEIVAASNIAASPVQEPAWSQLEPSAQEPAWSQLEPYAQEPAWNQLDTAGNEAATEIVTPVTATPQIPGDASLYTSEFDFIDTRALPQDPFTSMESAIGQLAGNNVRVRETPNLDTMDNILFQVSRGQAVEILDIVGDFYRVTVNDSQGVYIFREFVSVTEAPGIAVQDGMAVKSAPYSGDVIGIRHSGGQMQVTGRYSDWYEVIHEGARGYVESSLLNVRLGASLPTVFPLRQIVTADLAVGTTVPMHQLTGSATIDNILAHSRIYLGVPYRVASDDPALGFDCSGFVTRVMRNFGIALQRSSAAMAANNGVYVARNNIRPGDLVFFATGGGSRVSHVGIYKGNNQFIHADTTRGVVITGMNEPYWAARFVRANRIF